MMHADCSVRDYLLDYIYMVNSYFVNGAIRVCIFFFLDSNLDK